MRVAVNDGRPGRMIDIVRSPDAAPAINGIGTVHHVAMAIANGDEQLRLQARTDQTRLQVTDVRDRQLFHVDLFSRTWRRAVRGRNGAAGIPVDEPLPNLGRDLKLPPWEEPHRQEIENRLPQVHVRVVGRWLVVGGRWSVVGSQ